MKISTDIIKKAVYELCYKANVCLNDNVYNKILKEYKTSKNIQVKKKLEFILKNAKTAYEEKMPLCQDTGQVIVFLEIGQNVLLTGEFIEEAVNSAVKSCYEENFFRKSVVKNAIFNRENTKTNTPCIIYSKYTDTNDIKISVLIKGAGSENKSRLEMLLPTSTREEIIKKCSEIILSAGVNACPPMFIGIGIGGTSEKSLIMSKEALLQNCFTEQELSLAKNIKKEVNKHAPKDYENCYALDIKLKTCQTHIACMPIGITINCHSDRFFSCIIKNNEIIYTNNVPEFIEINNDIAKAKEIKTTDIETLKQLKEGEEFLLTGELYVARDMAHKKLADLLDEGKNLPFDLKDKIIFYAGPCPKPPNKTTGAIGPTTAGRMDKYALKLYNNGVFATIGKGARNEEITNYIKNNKKKYFSIQGGIASFLAKKVKSSEIIAYEELGTEAVYKITVEKIPVKVEI